MKAPRENMQGGSRENEVKKKEAVATALLLTVSSSQEKRLFRENEILGRMRRMS